MLRFILKWKKVLCSQESARGSQEGNARRFLLLLSIVVAMVSFGRSQGIMVDLTTKDSVRVQGRLLSVRDTAVIVESNSNPALRSSTSVVRLVRFGRLARIEYVDHYKKFNSGLPYLMSCVGGLLFAGISLLAHETSDGPSPSSVTYAIVGVLEGAILGGLLGWALQTGADEHVLVNDFTPDVRDRLKELSRFPVGEPKQLRTLVFQDEQ